MSRVHFSNDQIAERALLASIMIRPVECMILVEQMGACAEWFQCNAVHKEIFLQLRAYVIANSMVCADGLDTIHFVTALRAAGKLEQCGGHAMLMEMRYEVPSALMTQSYAETVRGFWIVRTTHESCKQIVDTIEAGGCDAQSVAADLAVSAAMVGARAVGKKRRMSAKDAANKIMQQIDGGKQEELFGLRTGFHKLNEVIGGLSKGDMILIQGARGSGKSAFALNLAEHFDRMYKLGTAYCTFEMTVEQQVRRLIQLRGRQNIRAYMKLNGDMFEPKGDRSLIQYGADSVKNGNIEFFDEKPATIDDCVSILRVQAAQGNLGLGILDYDELLKLKVGKGASKEEALAEIAAEWKNVAGELGITCILLSQVTMSKDGVAKARWSQAKENFANIILTVYEEEDGSRSVSVDKNRDGSRGAIIKFDFLGPISMFTEKADQGA